MTTDSEQGRRIQSGIHKATRYLSFRARTVFEMRVYLKKKGFTDSEIAIIVDYLIDKRYLNDEDFTKLYIESQIRRTPKSKQTIFYELKKKGVITDIVDRELMNCNDTELAIASVSPKIKHWQHLERDAIKKKVMNYLRYRGFSYDICLKTLDHVIKTIFPNHK